MNRNTTPTNELIMEAAELYAMLLAVLSIPVTVNVVMSPNGKAMLILNHDVSCRGVKHAAIFYSEPIAQPLMSAYVAAHALSELSLDRAVAGWRGGSPISIAARSEVKRFRAIIAEAEATARREIIREVQHFVSDMLS